MKNCWITANKLDVNQYNETPDGILYVITNITNGNVYNIVFICGLVSCVPVLIIFCWKNVTTMFNKGSTFSDVENQMVMLLKHLDILN